MILLSLSRSSRRPNKAEVGRRGRTHSGSIEIRNNSSFRVSDFIVANTCRAVSAARPFHSDCDVPRHRSGRATGDLHPPVATVTRPHPIHEPREDIAERLETDVAQVRTSSIGAVRITSARTILRLMTAMSAALVANDNGAREWTPAGQRETLR